MTRDAVALLRTSLLQMTGSLGGFRIQDGSFAMSSRACWASRRRASLFISIVLLLSLRQHFFGFVNAPERYPFESNVFCMTHFAQRSTALPDPVPTVIDRLREVTAPHNLTLHLASDRQAEDDLFGNVGDTCGRASTGSGCWRTEQRVASTTTC